ncbi:MAG TPA: ATP-binding protein [Ktedonobacteraceae bacterium]|jgi:signal transduction histidine kinase|nr:ATP-binding protein [Ktedonobacteraceae bacterium]
MQPQKEPSEEILSTELLATVGHEFRGPLTIIQGYANTLLHHEQHLSLEERREFLQAIEQAGAHLSTLVDRFLQLAQLETHTFSLALAPVDLAALAHEAMTAVRKGQSHILLQESSRTKTGSPGKTGEREQAVDEDLAISGDRRLLRILLDLLLENAVAYSAPDSLIEIHIRPGNSAHLLTSLHTRADSKMHVALIVPASFREDEALLEIEVRDHGRGIPPEQFPLIFHRFYRGDTRLTREVNGLGLGLALCQAIVTHHRGMLWVESAVGAGSAFHIVLSRGRTLPDAEVL